MTLIEVERGEDPPEPERRTSARRLLRDLFVAACALVTLIWLWIFLAFAAGVMAYWVAWAFERGWEWAS